MLWAVSVTLLLFGVFLYGARAFWRAGRYNVVLHSFAALLVSVTVNALLTLRFAPSLGVRWVALLGLFFLSLQLLTQGELGRIAGNSAALPTGVSATLRTVALLVGSSTIFPLLVFSFAPSASSLWLLVAPAVLLFPLWSFVKGLMPSTVRLNMITLDEVSVARPGSLRIAHLSDLHLCSTPAMEGALSPDRVREAAEKALRWALDRAKFVLVTGDLTDVGLKEEWQSLAELLAELDPDRTRIHLVPGNHDLSITLENNDENDGELLLEHEEQHHHFATSILRYCPPSCRIWTSHGDLGLSEVFSQAESYSQQYEKSPPKLGQVQVESWKTIRARVRQQLGHARGESWKTIRARLRASADYLDDIVPPIVIAPALKQVAEQEAHPFWPSLKKPLFMHLIRDLYPMVFYEDKGCIIIGLNSNTVMANNILSGAFGFLGKDQLERLGNLLERSGDRCKIVMLHHHIGEPDATNLTSLLGSAAMKTLQLVDAADLHRMLARYKNVLVLHGHEHIGYHARKGAVTIVSAPSVAYGNQTGKTNCFVYEVYPDGSQPRELIRVVETATITAK